MSGIYDVINDAARASTERDIASLEQSLAESIANGDSDAAVDCRRALASYQEQLRGLGGPRQAQLSADERRWLAARPGIAGDPQKLRMVAETAQTLMAAGYVRGSPEFFRALEFKTDSEQGELPSADELVKITMGNSRYGPDLNTPEGKREAYQRCHNGWEELQRRKAAGDYR
jgi:hypothetical protein